MPQYAVYPPGTILNPDTGDGLVDKTYRFVTDQVGSIRLVIDAEEGTLQQRLDYDAFGNVLLDSRPEFQPFGFAAGIYLRGPNLVRFGARDYDPLTGRWTAKDPILFAGGQDNLYAYCGNDPVNCVDPSGLIDWYATLEPAANFAAGFGDSLTFNATAGIRQITPGGDPVDYCSVSYLAGETTETVGEIALTAGSAFLKKRAAAIINKRAFGSAARAAARRKTPGIGGFVHHVETLFGHPQKVVAAFPSAGLGARVYNSSRNLRRVSQSAHILAHRWQAF